MNGFSTNIQKYIDNKHPSKTVIRYISAAPDVVKQSINKILKDFEPSSATLKLLVETALDTYSKTNINHLGSKDFLDVLKNSGVKDAIKRLKKIKDHSSNADIHKKSLSRLEKRNIVYEKNKGGFFKNCPCTPGAVNCNYFILSPGIGCPFNCSYCFLNFYSDKKDIIIYSNLDDMFREFINFIDTHQNPIRIGTGEFIDSLALKELDEVNKELVNIVKKHPWVTLEFKTKSSRIDNFLNIEPSKNIVLSWSLNPQWIIDKEEPGTAPLKERLSSACKAVRYGYMTALHLDPIFMTDKSLKDYLELVDEAFETIPAEAVLWLSMGGFRYTEELKLSILENNNGKKWFFGYEYVRCKDGKYRYPASIRIKFYNEIKKRIMNKGNVKTYLCMEDKNTWGSFNL